MQRLTILLACTCTIPAMDSAWMENPLLGVRIQLMGIDSPRPRVRVENDSTLTVALKHPVFIRFEFFRDGKRYEITPPLFEPVSENFLAPQFEILVPPFTNLEVLMATPAFDYRSNGHAETSSWSRGTSLLERGSYSIVAHIPYVDVLYTSGKAFADDRFPAMEFQKE